MIRFTVVFLVVFVCFSVSRAQVFDHPLTGSASKNINTWLLGVWEHKDDEGKTYRATVTPKTGSLYWVNFQALGKTPSQTRVSNFEAWISRIGATSFLTLRALDGDSPVAPGRFAFAQFTLLDQDNIRLRVPEIDLGPETSSFDLRREVRKRIKDQMLFPDRGGDWTRISEVYWSKTDDPQPFQPLRYPMTPSTGAD